MYCALASAREGSNSNLTDAGIGGPRLGISARPMTPASFSQPVVPVSRKANRTAPKGVGGILFIRDGEAS